MKKTIVVVGATGNLGLKIINSLLSKGAAVKALVRSETGLNKIKALENKGVIVNQVNFDNKSDILKHLPGAHCIVSALAGLEESIVDIQKNILEATIEAKVQRFIPSDYSIDFTNLTDGQNRNLDIRKRFHQYLDKAPINATTIFNGPFMDLLTTDMPLILFKQKRILCWGNPSQIMEFTTTHNVAEYTAEVALDNSSPRYLRIAGDRLSCIQFKELLTMLTGEKYKIFRPGGIKLLNLLIKITKFFSPSKKELYPAWQGMQYMRDMMEGKIIFQQYDNNRYPQIKWTTVKDFLISKGINDKEKIKY